MRKTTIMLVCTVMLASHVLAQEQLSVRQQANKLYERYQYFKALSLYLKAPEKTQADVLIIERIADCYRNIQHYTEAEKWYAKAAVNPKISKNARYYYAEVLLRLKKFDAAKEQFRIALVNAPKLLAVKLAGCDSAGAWIREKPVFAVKNESGYNTEFSDWGLNYDGADKMMLVSDRKNDDPHVDNRTGNNWFKVFAAPGDGAAIKQQFFLSTLQQDIFEGSYHVGPITFNAATDTAYITINTSEAVKAINTDNTDPQTKQRLYTRRLQLVIAAKKGVNWTIFKSFDYNNIQQYSVGNAALSQNGQFLYFTSDMPGGEGGTDIWYCEKQKNNSWSKPVNCGKNINTREDEDFATIGGDGKLYYSSKGLVGMGGFDIYRSTGQKARWTAPEDLKYPINSTSDDFYLITPEGTSGYLSSNREGGKGSDDIYSFAIAEDSIPAPRPQLALRKPQPDSSDAVLNDPSKFAVSGVVLKTIYYDLDKSEIRPDAAAGLDKLAAALRKNKTVRIEISSYTDSRASEAYNLLLSQHRAESAVYYLVDKGIDRNRMTAKYYGKTHLVNNCPEGVTCSEAQHQLNRRTEFKVLK